MSWNSPAPAGYYGAPTPAGRPTNKQAVTAMVLAFASVPLSCLGIVTAIIAIVIANGALNDIRAGGYAEPGDGLARVGRAVAIIVLVVYVLGALLYAGMFLAIGLGSTNSTN